jgi:hypothetical protein
MIHLTISRDYTPSAIHLRVWLNNPSVCQIPPIEADIPQVKVQFKGVLRFLPPLRTKTHPSRLA